MVYVKRKNRQTLRLSIPRIKTKVRIPLASGECHFYSFEGLCSYKEHIALSFKKATLEERPMVFMHSSCFKSDGLEPCACGDKLWEAIQYFSDNSGILLYLGQDDCEEPSLRNYKPAAQMLTLIEVKTIRLLSSTAEQVLQLREQGIEILASS
ncbi:MAG: cyclohydrolase [Gammaproteobacteria bacterium]|jgi:GTP cyclohydrolase II|nr:cyclohydrolase [Gammaproteobacteria bacterium]